MVLLVLILCIGSFSLSPPISAEGTGSWSSPLDVNQAMNLQDGSSYSVEGYITGKPISTTTVITSNYPDDYALAIANSSQEQNTSNMIYVQIPSNYRSEFGLKSNPDILGKKIKLTGCLTDYFSHAGVKCVSEIEFDSTTSTSTTSPFDSTYYLTAVGKTGNSLKIALHDIIDDHVELSYSNVWDALRHTDEDPNNSNNVILLYTGRSQDKYQNGGDIDDWNREHVWAKSHGDFGTSMGAGTDLHHLRPTDVTVNSSRGNKDFDNGGSPHSEANGNYSDSDSWEPRDEVKGDVARMLFYMAVRYEGDVTGEVDLELNDFVNNGSVPFMGKLSTLLEWHESDPVDAFERNRNDVIYTNYQGNRNPFIDHPEWVESIFSF
ncbi:endonuclease [Bacillus spongiae]|uniref:Endonuclease n=1 Tax=Bacillus spongiae TaxID=2683610 RepID=A0ABU8HAU6_9BACI